MTEAVEYVVSKLRASRGRWRDVERGSGVSIRTFEKIARGLTKDPRNGTVDKLTKYFREQEEQQLS